jgi:uncharacterized protein DUF4190
MGDMSYGGGGSGNGGTPPPPPPPPGTPPFRARPVPSGPNNGMAIAALCCGIAGFLCIIPAILGIIFGFVAKSQIRAAGYLQRGDGMATAGIVLGIVWIVLSVILFATGSVDISTE